MALVLARAPAGNEDKDDNPRLQRPPPADKTRIAPAQAVWNGRSACSRCAWISQQQKNVRQTANHASTSLDNIGRDLIACEDNDPKPDGCLAVFGHANWGERRQETGDRIQ